MATSPKHRLHRAGLRIAGLGALVVAALALGACSTLNSTAPEETSGTSGVTVYGTVDAGVGRSGSAGRR